LTNRIFRATVFGLIFWPIQFYALWMLMTLFSERGTLSANRRWKVWASVALNLPLLALVLVPLFCLAGLLPTGATNR
jgi:hypothetical protein